MFLNLHNRFTQLLLVSKTGYKSTTANPLIYEHFKWPTFAERKLDFFIFTRLTFVWAWPGSNYDIYDDKFASEFLAYLDAVKNYIENDCHTSMTELQNKFSKKVT